MKTLSLGTQAKVKSLLIAIAEGEKSVEKQRRILGRNPLFEPYAAFQRIDRRRVGFVNSIDLLNFLRDSGFDDYTEADTFYLIQFFDCDEDDKLNYTEFLSLSLPCDNAKLRSEITQRPNYFVGREDFLSKSVEFELCKLFVKEIAMHHRVEKLKQEITVCYDFTPENTFHFIDDFSYGYIDFSNLKRFLKKNGYIPSNKDLAAIIRRLDLNADSKLGEQEFVEGIKPVEPYSKTEAHSTAKCCSERKKVEPKKKKKKQGKRSAASVSKSYSQAQPRGQTAHPYESPKRGRSPLRTTKSPARAASKSPPRAVSPQSTRSPLRMTRSPARFGHTVLSPERLPLYASVPLQMTHYHPRPISPMRYGEETELVNYLRDLMTLETDLEAAKSHLAAKPDFSLVDCFRLFDFTGRGWASFDEFREGLASLGLYPSLSDMELVFERYDRDRDGTLSYSEFCDIFAPKSAEHHSILNARNSYYIHKSYYRRDEFFHPETRRALEDLFRTHFSVEASAEHIRQ
jgi:Ca2+-binding EF-hand superfamily protein